MKPTRLRAFSDAYGSWKIIISSRRIGRISARERCVMSRPWKTIRPSVGSRRRITQRAIVDLPQPDSPTTPSVSPLRTLKLTPSTAFTAATCFWKTIPRVTGKCFFRFSTTRSSSPAGTPFAPAAAALDIVLGSLRHVAGEELIGLAILRLLVQVARLHVTRVARDRPELGDGRPAHVHHVRTARV